MSNIRARYHELVAQQEEKTAALTELIEERSHAIIEQRDFSRQSEIVQLEYDFHALSAAVMKAHELAEKEEASL